jgi:hypothetical protein
MWGALSDRQMRHEVVGRGAVPVFFAMGCVDDIAGIGFDDLLPAHLNQAAAFGDVQGLSAVMGMPGTARSGGVKRTAATFSREGGSPLVMGSTHASPVKVSAGPFAVVALREISMRVSWE